MSWKGVEGAEWKGNCRAGDPGGVGMILYMVGPNHSSF